MVATAKRRCPQCGAEVVSEGNPSRPFCSERCKLIDLGNWLGESYRIPGAALEDESISDDDDSSERGSH